MNSSTTKEQTIKFLNYFISSHSWYKHLSMKTPVDFVFYLDKNAWMKESYSKSLFRKEKLELEETDQTEIMRERYGFWNFNGGLIRGLGNHINSTYIINDNMEKEILRRDKIDLGKIGLTAFIHPCFSNGNNEDFKEKHIKEIDTLKNHLLHVLEYSEQK